MISPEYTPAPVPSSVAPAADSTKAYATPELEVIIMQLGRIMASLKEEGRVSQQLDVIIEKMGRMDASLALLTHRSP